MSVYRTAPGQIIGVRSDVDDDRELKARRAMVADGASAWREATPDPIAEHADDEPDAVANIDGREVWNDGGTPEQDPHRRAMVRSLRNEWKRGARDD